LIGAKRVLALIPARGGTDRVPYLNIKRLGDRPLIAHTIHAARAARSVDRVVVSTDDPSVAEVAKLHGAEVPFLRPTELARDIPSLKPVVAHAVATLEAAGDHFDVVVVLQATTPFRDEAAIEAVLARLVSGGFDTVLTVTEDRTLNWRVEGERLVPLFAREGRRDEQEPVFKENGAVVASLRGVFEGGSRFGDRVSYLVLDKKTGFTVHDGDDFWMAEKLLKEPRILFRVDGSGALGMGHVYRSLAIADALREMSRADIAFLMSAEHSEGLVQVSRHGYAVRALGNGSVETALDHIRDFAPTILINDLPVLEEPYLQALSRLGAAAVNLVDTVDDIATDEYAQVIVSVMAAERETPEGFYTGPRYAILRNHFLGRRKVIRAEPRVLLLTFGGSDPQGLTLKALHALRGLEPGIEIVVVLGPAFSHKRDLEALLSRLGRRVSVTSDAAGSTIADLMLEADLVLCSGGMSVYEIAALGTPGIVLGQNAREESRMRAFASQGTIVYLGLGPEVSESEILGSTRGLLQDPGRRQDMSARGRALVDGLGAARAAVAVLESEKRLRETVEEGGRG
jgi:spore coat polysaccharide biosynthesis predicted glycosyltransferase SpsG/CMP-N-acetylneuraminic acid synthetase